MTTRTYTREPMGDTWKGEKGNQYRAEQGHLSVIISKWSHDRMWTLQLWKHDGTSYLDGSKVFGIYAASREFFTLGEAKAYAEKLLAKGV